MNDFCANDTVLDCRRRFFFQDSPVRGDIVQIHDAYQSVLRQKNYPSALRLLLGETMACAALLIGTLKTTGRLSLQLQASDANAPLRFAMAECDHTGKLRAIADFGSEATWQTRTSAADAFAALGEGVVFVQLRQGDADYQGVVEKIGDDLGQCIAHYQQQSTQIPTFIRLSADGERAAGLLLQKLPESDADAADADLWDRATTLAHTLQPQELALPPETILHRLYHQERLALAPPFALGFGCACSQAKSEAAIWQLGKSEALAALDATGSLSLDCGFCGAAYRFDADAIKALFAS